uniref:Uncharacterized protein n=1 Tax=Octopus bimaculoides TaxID=37653 RepID=A0A0L8I165_OCTBM
MFRYSANTHSFHFSIALCLGRTSSSQRCLFQAMSCHLQEQRMLAVFNVTFVSSGQEIRLHFSI